MAKKAKDAVNLSMKFDRQVAEALEAMSEDSGIPKTIILEKAAMEFIERYNKTGKIKP